MDMHGPYLACVESCVVPSGSAGTSGAIILRSCVMLGSSILTTCGGALALPYTILGS